jgi:protein-S-isoprenylcysteine O-methyltransferase Ste14
MKKKRFGADGEWWVVAQVVLGAITILAPFVLPTPVVWPQAVRSIIWGLGISLGVIALILAGGGIVALGHSLRAAPRPKENGQFVPTGVYAVVRHPIYTSLITGAFAWALMTHSLAAFLMAVVLFVFFDQKSRREEVWLAERYADYPAYRLRVHKLIPYIY